MTIPDFPISVLTREQVDYSALFDVAERPPQRFFVQGRVDALEILKELPQRGLAIVGTRKSRLATTRRLHEWITALKRSRLIIVSGFALGIDSAAHEAALACGLPTIAVLGTSLHADYPRQNRELRKKILHSGGLLISEYPPDLRIEAYHFVLRNRLIATWSRATLVVEAGRNSGALGTAGWAQDLDRKVYAVPAFPDTPEMLGNQWLLDEGFATPFWGPHSLGEVWLECSTTFPVANSPSSPLQAFCKTLERHQRIATLDVLMEWANQQGIDNRQFFDALRCAKEKGQITEKNGHFFS